MGPKSSHSVNCSIECGPPGTQSNEDAMKLASRLANYAKKLGFGVLCDSEDEEL